MGCHVGHSLRARVAKGLRPRVLAFNDFGGWRSFVRRRLWSRPYQVQVARAVSVVLQGLFNLERSEITDIAPMCKMKNKRYFLNSVYNI